ncbi:MAG TPA: hypothetical protein VLT85_04775, partial [Terriglobales bacterium]|nr:hypothetical protein [Terriglobales bacterium]
MRLVRLAAWVTVALAGVEAWLSFFPSSARCSIRPSTVWLLIVGMAAAPHVAVAWPGSPRKWQLALAYAWSWALTVLLWLSLLMTFD